MLSYITKMTNHDKQMNKNKSLLTPVSRLHIPHSLRVNQRLIFPIWK